MEEISVCEFCSRPAEAGGYTVSLCATCRNELAGRPLPWWLIGAGAVALVLVFIALAQFPSTFRAGVAFERGSRAEAAGEYATAVAEYRVVVDRFPDSVTAVQRLGISEYRAGNLREAARTLRQLGGQPGDEADVREVNQVMEAMARRMADENQPRSQRQAK
jgi:hypothetical protein